MSGPSMRAITPPRLKALKGSDSYSFQMTYKTYKDLVERHNSYCTTSQKAELVRMFNFIPPELLDFFVRAACFQFPNGPF